eukprot:CAMPEP_0113474692 /NCGR_PEP_ID=MMETSP0014_2-20120614/18722_1 /TAXON_ID=2857 /ORGANISM="Nitzschia sp." /LENGTH=367 /DNA_ID=CAMNT_0000367561 /DNA_START=57 /DNA_END=1160 /DNA_ORIENTATION=- /assembly_acc=CAM_ASM_000159
MMYRGTQLTVGLGCVLLTLLYFKQESMLYFPEIGGIPRRPQDNPRRYRSPSEHQVPYEDVQIQCEDGVQIHAWLMMRTQQPNPLPTLIYFHGNAGNIGLRIPNALQMMQYLNVNILMVEYRGYGNSDNVSPTEEGIKLDGQAALEWARKHPKLDNTKLFLFGRSLGGAVCFSTADFAQKQKQQDQGNSSPPVAGVIVENTFKSIDSMVDHLMPVVAPFKSLVLRMHWDSSKIVPTLESPVLYLAGAKDQLVPPPHMIELHQKSISAKINKMHVVEDGTHNETWMQGGQPYWDAIKAFIIEAVQSRGTSTTTMATADSVSASTLASSSASSSSGSSIPIMPNKLFGMVKEAIHSNNDDNDNNGGKKEL